MSHQNVEELIAELATSVSRGFESVDSQLADFRQEVEQRFKVRQISVKIGLQAGK